MREREKKENLHLAPSILRAERRNISWYICNPFKADAWGTLLWSLMELELNSQAVWSLKFPFLNPLTSGFLSPVFTDDIYNDGKLYE